MENLLNETEFQIAEVDLIYKSKVKASERPGIKTSKDAWTILQNNWDVNKIDFIEQFKVILLNRANRVLGILKASSGGVTGTLVDPKVVFVAALKANACGIIISHNHPSGNLKPSLKDQQITAKLKNGAELLDISLLDHLIITSEGYLSFADEGLL